jgi:hypothetical protein
MGGSNRLLFLRNQCEETASAIYYGGNLTNLRFEKGKIHFKILNH